jgi:integrase
MSILQECPVCHRQQSLKNKKCVGKVTLKNNAGKVVGKEDCREDLNKARRSNRLRYWITYRLPNGKQRKEFAGNSIKEARESDGKRKVQKKENRILDILPESKMTFQELADWYTDLKTVQSLASYKRIELAMNNFNNVFGNIKVMDCKQSDLTDYQMKRQKAGRAPATIDMEVKIVQTAVTMAFDNDMIDGRSLKAFRKTKRLLRKGDNARDRVLSMEEISLLIEAAQPHLKPVIEFALYTGMRAGEIRGLRFSHIDFKKMFIRLPAEVVKEGRKKDIPINRHMAQILREIGKVRRIDHDYVFTYRNKPVIYKNGFKKAFITTCTNANIPYGRKVNDGITFHDLRRTAKTNMLIAGLDKVFRDKILGHSLQGMDVNYLVLNEDALTRAMGKYTSWLDTKLNKQANFNPNKLSYSL